MGSGLNGTNIRDGEIEVELDRPPFERRPDRDPERETGGKQAVVQSDSLGWLRVQKGICCLGWASPSVVMGFVR